MEIEGTVDLAVECVSDASSVKDRRRLRDRYHRAGVPEYWIVDVRGKSIEFRVLLHREEGYAPAPRDRSGFVRSRLLGKRVRLVARRRAAGLVFYRLEVRRGKN